ncbi:hypothetical protein CPB86DRAFT_871643 [Serendipita vermifera]|nr:hypothetical protein CPB86DRAFT_871643 [Serendipita vermifera]
MTTTGHWETIRPWTDRLSIQVKDLTSISATFILSSAIAGIDEVDGELATLHAEESASIKYGPTKSIGEALSRGFHVKVNGNNWNNCFVNVEPDESEAVIILYGLRPGKQYEVELTIEQDQTSLRKDFTTFEVESVGQPANEELLNQQVNIVPDIPVSSAVEVTASRDLTPPITPDSASPPPPIPRNLTVDELKIHLQLTQISTAQECESLTNQLKMARKESQRAENSTRAEIEALKKATEKQQLNDQRAKQKVLALQEAIKQTIQATADLETQASSLQADLPRLRQEEAVLDLEHSKLTETATQKDAEIEQTIRIDKKKIADLQAELTSTTNRLDKLAAKRDKLANETIPDFEQQLEQVRKEIEEAEAERDHLAKVSFPEEAIAPSGFRNAARPSQGPWPGPRLSGGGQFPPNSHATPYPPINANAPPFYPRQPGMLYRPAQAPARPINEFQPFNPPMPMTEGSHGALFQAFAAPPAMNRTSKDSH